jgi:putative membrane protein
MKFITKTLITAVAVIFAAYILRPGINVPNSQTAILVALVLGLLNSFVRPILILLTIPITIFTLGLFLLVINILMIKLTAEIVTDFKVESWWAALWFSVIVSVISAFIQSLIKNPKEK